MRRHDIHWPITSFFALTTLGSIFGLAWYIPKFGIHPLEPIVTAGFVFLVALAIAGGYHRLFSHRAYRAHPLLKIIFLVLGAAGFQQSAIKWCAEHRLHHRFVDTDKDPYNVKRGFWWAHIGWVLHKDPRDKAMLLKQVPDLAQDKWVMWQYRHWTWVGTVLSLGVALGIGFLIGRPLGMFLWAGVLRIVITLQTTFTINSISHYFGKQPYSNKDSSRDVWWLAPFLVGESYHNYHHTFQYDYRNGIRWYHWDPVKWLLWTLNHTPLVSRLKRTPPHLIWKAKLEMDILRLERKWNRTPEDLWQPIRERLLKMRQGLIEASEHMAQAKQNYRLFKKEMREKGHRSLEQAKALWKEQEEIFKQKRAQWKTLLQWASRGPALAMPA